MHAKCHCGAKFCGFCFKEGCNVVDCPLNPTTDEDDDEAQPMASNLVVSFLKAARLLDLLSGESADARESFLARSKELLASAGLDASLPHLVAMAPEQEAANTKPKQHIIFMRG